MQNLIFAIFFIVCAFPALTWADEVEEIRCLSCHKEVKEAYSKTRHGLSFGLEGGSGCANCHGDGKEHLDAVDREDKDLKIENFSKPSAEASKKCLACHERGETLFWKGSTHSLSGVSCFSCHKVHSATRVSGTDICLNCHQDKRAQILKSSHMPVREGKMTCSGCHNPHGSIGPKMLKTPSVNETCYSCHSEKRGPFLWEHAVVRESCANCHDPHGSNNPGLLKSKGPFLCTQCHQYGGHVNMPRYNRASAAYGKGCINCHTRIHGSNHPSGAKFTR
ncbi:MAG: hypothetical protein A3I81_09510 [Deltaproteobacteria bacterium RIFCSPLOWO2_02_FULL_55_12]|nr:MAG: hypothetical protein A3I81_09510 [Deltaproteobacteria bacterium RIFCSPLOWO2_02_FULL_55_12]